MGHTDELYVSLEKERMPENDSFFFFSRGELEKAALLIFSEF